MTKHEQSLNSRFPTSDSDWYVRDGRCTDGRLNSVYGHDDSGDFYVILFAEDATHAFGTVNSLSELDQQSAQVFRQWVTEGDGRGGFLDGIFGDGNDEASTTVECQDLRMDTRPQGQQIPLLDQENQTQ